MTLDELDFYLPDTLQIKSPIGATLPRGRGQPKTHTCPISVRYAPEDVKRLEAAASVLNMDKSQFIRWCNIQTALAISREYEKQMGRSIFDRK